MSLRGYPKINGRWLNPRRFGPFVDDDDVPQSNYSFETLRTDVPPSNEPSIPQSNVHLSNKLVLTNVSQSNEHFQTIPTDVPLSNDIYIFQSNFHLLNELVLTNFSLSNEPMLINVPLSIELEQIIGQTEPSAELRFEPQPEQVKDLVDFRFKSVVYTKDPYDFSKEFNIDPVGLQFIGIPKETWSNLYIPMSREEAEKSEARLTPWVTDHYGTCSCRWWQTMGIPYEYGVRALDLANVDPAIRVSEYFTNDAFKAVYEPIWIPIRGI
ncbi:hypothetical protein GIB67_038029, partial [Kingdonia uniflora]